MTLSVKMLWMSIDADSEKQISPKITKLHPLKDSLWKARHVLLKFCAMHPFPRHIGIKKSRPTRNPAEGEDSLNRRHGTNIKKRKAGV